MGERRSKKKIVTTSVTYGIWQTSDFAIFVYSFTALGILSTSEFSSKFKHRKVTGKIRSEHVLNSNLAHVFLI